jgi:4'-phosphopantetheinyl transferase
VTKAAEAIALTRGTVHVWLARAGDAAAGHMALLDETESERWAAYLRGADRDRFLVGCALAKSAIAACTGRRPEEVCFDRTCRQCGGPHGKPVIRGGLEHSVAHSGDLVAVALARAPIGVDVEQLDGRPNGLCGAGNMDELARLVLADAERAALAAVPAHARARQLLIAWTRKEAVTKATGDGLRTSFSDVVVAADNGAPRLVAWPYPQSPDDVSLHDLDVGPGYVAALAVIGRCDAVQAADGSALLATRAI